MFTTDLLQGLEAHGRVQKAWNRAAIEWYFELLLLFAWPICQYICSFINGSLRRKIGFLRNSMKLMDCSCSPTVRRCFLAWFFKPRDDEQIFPHPGSWHVNSAASLGCSACCCAGFCFVFGYTGRISGFVSFKIRKRCVNFALRASSFFRYLDSSNFSSSRIWDLVFVFSSGSSSSSSTLSSPESLSLALPARYLEINGNEWQIKRSPVRVSTCTKH